MTTADHLKLGIYGIRLLANIFIIWPALAAASLIFVLLLMGGPATKEIGEPLHRFVIIASFEQPASTLHSIAPTQLETLPVAIELAPLTYDTPVPESVAVDRITDAIVTLYWWLVALSVTSMLSWKLLGWLLSSAKPRQKALPPAK